jgi:hypothetical protein
MDDLSARPASATDPEHAEALEHDAAKARRARFECLAKANLRCLYVQQLRCLNRAADDPRVTKAHWQVLTRFISHTNAATGMSHPGRDYLAADITYYDDARAPQHYAPQTISNLTFDLRQFGYLGQDQRGIDGKGRAVAHYVTIEPDVAYLQEQIAQWCASDKPRRKFPKSEADLLTGKEARNETSHTDGKVSQKAGLLSKHPKTGSGLLSGHARNPIESGKRAGQLEEITGREERGATAPPAAPAALNGNADLFNGTGPAASSPLPAEASRSNGSAAGSSQPGTGSAPRRPRAKAANPCSDPDVLAARDAYNEGARAYRWVVNVSFPEELASLLRDRLLAIGVGNITDGLQAFKRALSAIPQDDWLSGRVKKDGRAPFKLDLEYLVRKSNGHILSKLIDRAGEAPASNGAAACTLHDMSGDKEHSRSMLASLRIEPDKPWLPQHGPPPYKPGCLFNPDALLERGFQPKGGSS